MSRQVARVRPSGSARAVEVLEGRQLLSVALPVPVGALTLAEIGLSQQRSGEAIGVVGSKVFLAGGETTFNYANFDASPSETLLASNAVDVFDAASGQLSVTAPMPEPRAEGSAIAAGGKLFVYGGWSGDYWNQMPLTSIDVYDVASNAWSVLKAPPGGDAFTPAAAVGDRVMFTSASQLGFYDATSGQWTTVPQPDVGGGEALVVVGSRVFFFGHGGAIAIYDADAGTFSTQQVAGEADFTGRHAVVDGRIVFAGGYGGSAADGGVYDTATGTWTPQSTGVSHGAAATVLGDKVIFGGGYVPLVFNGFYFGAEGSSAVAIYDAASGQWSTAQLSAGRFGLSAFTVGHQAFFAGGTVGFDEGDSNIVDVYDDSTATWSTAAGLGIWDNEYGRDSAYPAGSDVLIAGYNAFDLFSPSPLPQPIRPDPFAEDGLAAAPTALSWSPVPGAQSYDLYLDDALVLNTTDASWTVDRPIAPGNHVWQVVARDGSGDVTPGQRWAFTVGAPAVAGGPSVRSGAHLAATPTSLSWAPVPGAVQYRVYLDGQRIADTTGTTLPLGQPLAGGKHTWFVVAYNGLTSTNGPTWSFSLPTVPLVRTVTSVPGLGGGASNALPVGNKILYYYGFLWSDSSPRVDIYDVVTGKRSQTTLPAALEDSDAGWGSATAVIGDEILFCGDGVAALYNVRTGRWAVHTLSTEREQPAVVAVGNEFVIAGGSVRSSGASSDAVDLYDVTTGQWSTAKLSQARSGISAAVVGGTLYLAGGSTGSSGSDQQPSAAVDIYDASSGAWKTAQLSVPRESAVPVVVGGRYVIFAGGYTPTSEVTVSPGGAVDVIDTQTGVWMTDQVPTGELFDGQGVAVGGRAYFVSSGDGGPGTLLVYDPATRTWAQQGLPASEFADYVKVLGRKLLISGSGSTIEVVDTKTGLATYAPLPAGGVGPVAAMRDRVVYLGGGNAGRGGPELDVYTDPALIAGVSADFRRIPIAGTITPRQRGSVSVSVRAAANTALQGPVTVSVYASTSPTLDDHAMLLGTVTVQSTSRRKGGVMRVDVPVQVPATIGGGPFYVVSSVEINGAATVASTRRPILRLPAPKHPARPHPGARQ